MGDQQEFPVVLDRSTSMYTIPNFLKGCVRNFLQYLVMFFPLTLTIQYPYFPDLLVPVKHLRICKSRHIPLFFSLVGTLLFRAASSFTLASSVAFYPVSPPPVSPHSDTRITTPEHFPFRVSTCQELLQLTNCLLKRKFQNLKVGVPGPPQSVISRQLLHHQCSSAILWVN